eukprot:s870_g2.t1
MTRVSHYLWFSNYRTRRRKPWSRVGGVWHYKGWGLQCLQRPFRLALPVSGLDVLPMLCVDQKTTRCKTRCIQGETGCGKSTRVPVYVMEEYFENRRAGKVKKEDKFMVLCTQPRHVWDGSGGCEHIFVWAA